MLCQIATDPNLSLSDLSKYRLFDLFVHFLLDREVSKRGRDPHFSLEVRRQFNRALALWLWSQGGVSTVTLASVPADICRAATSEVKHDYDDTALRKELTAGCLIEKGATTIFFGHRSLQEFLVAEELIATNFGHVDPDDKSGSLSMLALITPEVGSFIVEAAKSFPASRDVVLPWLRILRNLKRKDVPRQGIRFFMELLAPFGDALEARSNEPWIIWLRYFIANGAVEFAPKSAAAVEQLSSSLKFLAGTKDQQAATLLLFAEVFCRSLDASRIAAQFIAAWLDSNSLRAAIESARRKGRNEHHYLSIDDDFMLCTFLHSAKVASNPPQVTINFRELRKRACVVLPMGFADEQEENLPDDLRLISTPAQSIYRAWGVVRESELEKVRPYFTDPQLRGKILPLEIVRRESKEAPAPPAKPVAQQPLTLKRRNPRV